MTKFCHSCSAPLENPMFKGASDIYCKCCTDEAGNLKDKGAVQQGLAQWLKTWQPGLDNAKAMERAEIFMKAMPAWTE